MKKNSVLGIILLFCYNMLQIRGQNVDSGSLSFRDFSPPVYPADDASLSLGINIIDILFVILLLCLAIIMWKKDKIKRWFEKQKAKKEEDIYYSKRTHKKIKKLT